MSVQSYTSKLRQANSIDLRSRESVQICCDILVASLSLIESEYQQHFDILATITRSHTIDLDLQALTTLSSM